MSKVNIEEWIELFEAVGLTEADRKKWHRLFEAKNTEGHQSFLEWLGLDVCRIAEIRSL